MKMSLCNTFRFFAVSTTIVLSIVGSPVPGLVIRHRNVGNRDVSPDLLHQGSLTVELKNEFKRPNDINNVKMNNMKDVTNSALPESGLNKNIGKDVNKTTLTRDKTINATKMVENTTQTSLKLIITTAQSSNLSSNKSIEEASFSTSPYKGNFSTPVSTSKLTKTVEDKNQSPVTSTYDANPATELAKSKNDSTQKIPLIKDKDVKANLSTTIENNASTLEINTTTMNATPAETAEKISESMEMSSSMSGLTTPTGKKYTVIERKRVTTTTEEPTSTGLSMDNAETTTLNEEPATMTDQTEVMVKSETAQGRISLQDTMTSDIPSLEKLKTDLLSYPKFTTKIDQESTTTSVQNEITITVETTTETMTTVSQSNSDYVNTVSSKRAGYLDLSPKILRTVTENLNGLILKGTESLQGPFDAETPDAQDELPEEKIESKVESQGQLAEDAIKEELLKEEKLNDNEENAKRQKDEQQPKQTDTPSIAANTVANNKTQSNDTIIQTGNTGSEDNLSVKPISLDKLKNTILYPVNPNYKPLKKIEVQPAKPFVRDPDDNSWRNESLSSLGIVFKPKNSSKPFTQVLKNKTETEWNNLSEKERKSEVPDLRVRLEQIAQKRKSKKKKIDSFGNVFYTDYEESSSSEESTRPRVEEPSVSIISTTDIPITTDITIVTPVTTVASSTPQEVQNISAFTTISTPALNTETTPTSKKEPNKANNVKTKLYNLFDYYEASDDDDIADYLNMAKIDLKKYTVPIQTPFTSLTSPPLPILFTTPLSHYTSERKGTIQYFPPRTTKRPRKNKHNNIVRNKINSFPITESPKNVIPMSYHKMPTPPYTGSIYYTDNHEMARLKEQNANNPKNFNNDLYLTTSPLTTLPDESFGVIGSEYNRDNFVIKHYKDYMNEAGPGNEHDHEKNGDFIGYTPPPQGVTISEFMKDTTLKDTTKLPHEYDYDSQFRKDVLDRFVANFNENTKRLKSDFPLVYNNSIVHGSHYNDKDVAMSSAYFRRPYGNHEDYKPLSVHDPYDPNCDNATVELSPAYELHYYVPEQEEKQEVEAKHVTLPVRYRL